MHHLNCIVYRLLTLYFAPFLFPENVSQYISSGSQDLKVVDETAPVIKPVDTLRCVGQVKRVTQHQQEPPLRNPFPMPRNFPPLVALALKEKEITSKDGAKFVTALVNAIFKG